MRQTISAIFIVIGFLTVCGVAYAANSTVPEPFQRFDATSEYTIDYSDFTALLKAVVVDVGRSNREIANPTQAKTGTRMKASVKRSTISEGNRFYFEIFAKNDEIRQMLSDIQNSLAQFPAEVPLEYFSRDEQLAYWLNLYNITLLNEIVKVYPKRNLKKLLVGKNSILVKKLLTVAGVTLSLNDIQFTILMQNYDNNPLIMYGLYQGIIGGPNIRKWAFTGENVYRNLKDNAIEFTNSNRGTYSRSTKIFRVSSLYRRNKAYFADFNTDLSGHLLDYLEGDERGELQAATTIKPDINDWTVTDLFGTYPEIGGSLTDNRAALMDSVRSTNVVDGQVLPAMAANASSFLVARSPAINRISPQLREYLYTINMKRMATSRKNAIVTMEELGETPVDPDPDPGNEENN